MKEKNQIALFKELKKKAWCGIWGKRILSELEYLLAMSESLDARQQNLVSQAIKKLWDDVEANGAVTKERTLDLETELAELGPEVKKLQVILIAHAHIDMNWMWGFQETASVTVDTFETMLQLMEEYSQFTFSQSQASVYRIIEEYRPEMLDQIRQRVREGRWEVTASTWVENDKNMSGSEAMARHILYTKTYLSKLLGIEEDSLQIDFEPDTFGHNENMPEILSQGGVKYYYHCRGYNKEHVYRWQAPSGAEVLVYREPVWYNDEAVEYDALGYVPGFCKKYGLDTAMKFYGVGDHGGGPTRKDIETWTEMQKWPLLPVIKFGTLKEFFSNLERFREKLPVVKQELNYIFTGCYTSQARIKRANKIGEDRLYQAEALDVMAKNALPAYRTGSEFRNAWEKVLFNQFHDILPGSGVIETTNYALGEFQKAVAASQINLNHAMRALCSSMDTSSLGTGETENRPFGAGVGFGLEDAGGYMTGFVSRAAGKRRVVTVFNPTRYSRQENVKVILWDWSGDCTLLQAWDTEGKEVPCEVTEEGTHYWGHHYHTVLLYAEVDAFGYETYVLDEKEEETLRKEWSAFSHSPEEDPRVDQFTDMPIVLENEKVRAVFRTETLQLISFVDKESKEEKIAEPSCSFRLIRENTVHGMTAWRVGTYMEVLDINQDRPAKLIRREMKHLAQRLEYEIPFENSKLKVCVTLNKGSRILHYDVYVDWHELGSKDKGVPQLNFTVPFGYQASGYLCNVPFGVKKREALAQDVPCLGFMCGEPKEQKTAVMVMSDCKYGFRGYEDSISTALLRGSYDPDTAPDQGEHHFRIGVGISSSAAGCLTEDYERFIHPLYTCSNSVHEGSLPMKDSFLQIEGNVKVTALKPAEDGQGVIVRMHNLQETEVSAIMRTRKEIVRAEVTDVLERKKQTLADKGKEIALTVPAGAVRTVYLALE